MVAPAARSASATSCLPRSRSRKNTGDDLGGDADVEFAADRFLDVRLRSAIFLQKLGNRIACLVPLGNYVRRYAKLIQKRPTKRAIGINDDCSRRVPAS